MSTSFYTQQELESLGFKSLGKNVLISKKASIYNPSTISLGNHVRIDDFCVISGGKGITFGSYIHIACYSALFGNSGIVFDDFAGLSSRVVIYTYSDDYSGLTLTNPTIPAEFRTHAQVGPVHLKKHVIIGSGTTILPGVTIGEGSAVGAHSLVTKSLDPWGIYFGCPAKYLKSRKNDLLQQEVILRSQYE